MQFLGSIVVSIPVCHTGDRGSIPRQGELNYLFFFSSNAFFKYANLMKLWGVFLIPNSHNYVQLIWN